MDIKPGHVLLSAFILVFMITGISAFLIEADRTTSVSNNLATSSFANFENNVSEINDLESNFNQKIDNTSDYVIADVSSNEIRGADSIGIINLFSKNILTQFFREVTKTLNTPGPINFLLFGIFGTLIGLLLIKFFWEKKVV